MWGGGLLGEEECEVEDREWSVAVVIASASSSSGDDDDDGMLIYDDFGFQRGRRFRQWGGGSNEGEYGGIPRTANALLGALVDIADSDDDDIDNNDNEDGESCDVDGGNGVMLSPSCLDNKLSSLTCLNDDELNVFDINYILVESIVSMLAVNDADKGGKDERDDESLLMMVPSVTWWTDSTRGANNHIQQSNRAKERGGEMTS